MAAAPWNCGTGQTASHRSHDDLLAASRPAATAALWTSDCAPSGHHWRPKLSLPSRPTRAGLGVVVRAQQRAPSVAASRRSAITTASSGWLAHASFLQHVDLEANGWASIGPSPARPMAESSPRPRPLCARAAASSRRRNPAARGMLLTSQHGVRAAGGLFRRRYVPCGHLSRPSRRSAAGLCS